MSEYTDINFNQARHSTNKTSMSDISITSHPDYLNLIDKDKLEFVSVSIGFDDILDVTIPENHSECDHLIVVTSHEDKKTQSVCRKHGVTCVPTDVHLRHDRTFNKGAAVNRGFDFFKYFGWRGHIDSDCILPRNFRRLFFNHYTPNPEYIYGMDRLDVVEKAGLQDVKDRTAHCPQHGYGYLINPNSSSPPGSRYLDGYDSYCPLGFFQLFHSSQQKAYPNARGDASHDDISFGKYWKKENRHLLPIGFCYHLVPEKDQKLGTNWKGRTQKRLK